MKIVKVIFLLFALVPAPVVRASTTSRVVRVIDSRTILTAEEGIQRAITLNGLVPGQGTAAARYLESFVGSLVLVEMRMDGTADIYRSSDRLWINAGLREETAHAQQIPLDTHSATYLGEAAPGPVREPRQRYASALSTRPKARPDPWRPRRPGAPARLPHLTRSPRRRH